MAANINWMLAAIFFIYAMSTNYCIGEEQL